MNIPKHIAVIMDGNGRWAKQHGMPRVMGHRAGTDATREIVRACGELGVEYLTMYTFSSENWSRPSLEVKALMSLLVEMVRKEIEELNKNNVRLKAIGDLSKLPAKVRKEFETGIEKTAANTGLTLILALSYGGRQEILTAARQLAQRVKDGTLKPEDIDEKLFAENLYDPNLPDPELLIRTGGEMRVSNYLLWQIAYTEIYVTPVLWPDFNKKHLVQAIENYHQRDRRFGRIKEKEA